jgi:hypothetical protein
MQRMQPLYYSYLKYLFVGTVVPNELSLLEKNLYVAIKKANILLLSINLKITDYLLQKLQKLFEPFRQISKG